MDKLIAHNNTKDSTRWLINFVYEVKRSYIGASALTLLSACCYVGFSWYLSVFAASWLTENQILSRNLLYASAFMAGRYVFAHLSSLTNYKAASSIVSKVKKKLYPKLLNNNHSDSISSTLLVTRVSDDLKPFFSGFIPNAIASALVAILILSISFWVEFWVGLTLLAVMAVIPFLMTMIGVGATSLHKKHIHLFMKYSAIFYNRLHTIAEIVNLNNLNSQHQFLSKKSKALNEATSKVMKVAILSSAVLELFVSIAIAGVAIYLGLSLLGIIPGNYGKGYDFRIALFLLILAPYLFFYLRKFVSAYHDKNKALASAKLLMPYFNEDNKKHIQVEDEKLESLKINELSFSYPDSLVKVLNNIHLEFPNKGLVLVKGISGSGKSTLLKILSGNLYVQEGMISLNGNNNEWSLQWLKENSTYMNQFPFIFDGTLHYNVFLDDKEESEKQYPDFLNKLLSKKEDGWQTLLSHNGKQLSGGEKQLVTLARMILYPKPIAVLDEPTANLDPETVKIVLSQIEKMARSKLLILASHDKKFEAIASKVLNLNWGEQMEYV